jgi:hypothetical protein
MFATTIANAVRLRLPVALAFTVCLLAGGPARAQDARFANMKEAMKALAGTIKKQMLAKGGDTIAIRSFEGPSGASGSSGIAAALEEQLKAVDVKAVKPAAGAWSVGGDFAVEKNEGTGMLDVRIESKLKDPRGQLVALSMTPIITNDSETLTMFGVTGTLPTTVPQGAKNADGSPQSLPEARADATLAAIDNPQVTVDKAVVKAAPASPYAVEILIKGQPIAPAIDGGVAFVDIPKGAEYEIRLINNSDLPAGVTLTIDGINSLVFSKQFAPLGKWVVLPGKPGIIRGWLFDGAPSRAFRVLDYGESVAAQSAATKDIGTITAVFCAAFEPGKLPEAERKGTRGQLATGLGSPVDQKLQLVSFEYGLDRAAVSIRYAKPDLSDLPPAEPNAAAAPPQLAN